MWTHEEMTERIVNEIVDEVLRPEVGETRSLRMRLREIVSEALKDAHDIGVDHAAQYIAGW